MKKKVTGAGSRMASRVVGGIAAVVLGWLAAPGDSHAAVSCNPGGYASIIGTELVAVSCVPDGMSDSTVIYYRYRDYECVNGVVTKTAEGNTIQTNPNGIMYPSNGMGSYFRHFRNKEGSYFLDVSTWYRGTIDGKSMSLSSYAGGGVYTDVFTQILDPSGLPAVPDCKGGDCNPPQTCPIYGPEKPAESTVNMETGRLSHSQDLFATKSSQPLSLDISLNYRSLQFAPSSIGNGWSHTYEMSLVAGSGNNMVLWIDGKRRIYTRTSATGPFVAPKGDWSALVKNADNSYTITEKGGLKRNFDTTGAITSVVDRNNNSLTFSYTSGKLAGVTDPNGRSATFSYDGSGKLATITDPKGNIYTLNYTSGQLVQLVNPDTSHWQYSYGGNGLLAVKTDPEGNTVTYSYDVSNRIANAADPTGRSRSYSYPLSMGNPGKIPDPYMIFPLPQKQLTFTEKDGNGWTYTYDTLTEYVTSMTDPLGHTTSFSYDSNRNLASKTEPGIGTTSYTYDGAGNVLTIKDPLNQTTTYTYNGFGEVLTVTGTPGTTTNVYDTKGNLTSTTDPANAQTQYGYDTKGNLTTITDPRGKVTTLAYDAANNLTSVTDPTGIVTQFTYDGNGSLLTATDAAGKITTSAYDAQNRLVTLTDPLGHSTVMAYDNNGNAKTRTDANSNVTTYTYNYQGRPATVKDALDHVTSLTYGVAGCPVCTGVDQLTDLTDAKGQKTSWIYDKIGRLTTETDPLNKVTSYSYGATKNPASKTDANGNVTNYTYDALQRLTQASYSGGSDSYTYDGRNNVLTAGNGNVTYTNTYDAANRLTAVTDSRGYGLSYQYDAAGNRTQLKIMPGTADERTITATYDNAGRPATIAGPAGTFTFGYDAVGRRSTLAYPNQVTASYGYDDAGRLTSIGHSGIASYGYTLDSVGNRTAKNGESYLYDAIYRLIKTVAPYGTENFTFDAVGNRTAGPGVTDTAYLHDAGNRMTEGRALQYGYDDSGNQTEKTVPTAGDKSWSQSWDGANRLTQVTKSKGGEHKTVTFSYDPFGRRVGKTVAKTRYDQATQQYVTTNESYAYVYDGDAIVLEVYTDPSNNVTKTFYTNGPGVDEQLALERNGSFNYYHHDGLNSVTAISDANRNVVQSYAYDSFGMVTPANNTFRNSFTYTGREWDKEAGLYYYRARYYDPMEGRFIAKDPISFAGGDVNLFGYVENDPINLTDPEGLDPRIFGGDKTNPVLRCHVNPHNDRCENAIGGAVIGGALVGCVVSPVSVFAHGGRSWHLGLELEGQLNLIHIGNHIKYGVHLALGYVAPRVAYLHVYLEKNFPFVRIWWPGKK